jgi:hypothetical protein
VATKQATLLKDNTSRKKYATGTNHRGRGTNDRLLFGKVLIAGTWWRTRSFIKWTLDNTFWDGVEVVTSATMTLTIANNTGDTELTAQSGTKVAVKRLKRNFNEGSGGNWSTADKVWPSINHNIKRTGTGGATPGTTITINVMRLLQMVAPRRVSFQYGSNKPVNGKGYTNYGFSLQGESEAAKGAAGEVWSQEHGTASERPSLDIVYEQVNTAPVATIVAPSGNVTADFDVDGTFSDANINDYMSHVKFQVEKNSVGNWNTPLVTVSRSREVSIVDDQWHVVDGDWDKGRLKKGLTYKMRAKVFDKHGKSSAWTADKTFTITSDTPTVTVDDFGTVATMDGVLLGGPTTVDSLTELLTVDVQVSLSGTLLWSHSYPITQGEKDSDVVSVEYAGPTLAAGSYDYQCRVTDKLGGQSAWNAGTFTLSADEPDTDEDLTNITGYSPISPVTRIVLYSLDTKNRGPKDVVGIIEDAANIGVSWYANAPGQLYFTLPVTHPQVGVCEPLTTHYQVQQFRRGRWKMLAAGLLYDFDARENDTIFYGMDYLGLLSWSVEAAKQPSSNHKKRMPTKSSGTNGSRYFKKTIKAIIRDQLKRARYQDSNSPVKFIDHTAGSIGNFDTKITIYASYVQRLDFIRGLIDSHKGAITTGGGERRSRLRVRFRKDIKRWVFDALDAVGSDRDNIRLEYGSLLQGYNVVAMGDYANLIYAAGHEPNKLKPHFAKAASPGVSQTDWGSIGQSRFWADITDNQDLNRRARAEAIKASRVGKKVALGIRVHGLAIWDGYEVLDNIPLSIDDGVVDTDNYGSGYWTIWGGEYRVYPDGHDETTLIIRPKGDGAAIDTDLIDSDPIHAQAEWKWGSGAPSG